MLQAVQKIWAVGAGWETEQAGHARRWPQKSATKCGMGVWGRGVFSGAERRDAAPTPPPHAVGRSLGRQGAAAVQTTGCVGGGGGDRTK